MDNFFQLSLTIQEVWTKQNNEKTNFNYLKLLLIVVFLSKKKLIYSGQNNFQICWKKIRINVKDKIKQFYNFKQKFTLWKYILTKTFNGMKT